MHNAFTRTEWLIGSEALKKLNNFNVAVFGIGGVGSFVVEALARTGVGTLTLVDHDIISITNINRQIHADTTTVGRPKVQAMKERILRINPKIKVICHGTFYSPETAEKLLSLDYDYVVDAIDSLSSKIDLVVRCKSMGIPIISSMGAGNKMDPTAFRTGDLYETSVDPIARIMRRELRKRGIDNLKVVYSTEPPIPPRNNIAELSTTHEDIQAKTKMAVGSIAFVPSVAGLIMAGQVVNDLIKWRSNEA